MSEWDLHTINVSLQTLEHFLETAEAGSFVGAEQSYAKRGLKITRFQISTQLLLLDAYLGVELFRRTKHSIQLTKAGEEYRSYAEAILRSAAAGRHRMQLVQPQKNGRLHLGYSPSPTEEFREDAIALFEDRNGSVRIIPHDLSADGCKRNIVAGRVGVAFVPEPVRLPEGLFFEPMIDYPICCIVGADHPLSCKPTIAVADLETERFLLLNRREFSQYHQHVCNILSPHFVPNFSDDEYDGYETLLSGVHHLNGIALLLFPVSNMSSKVKVLPFHPVLKRIAVGAVFMSPPSELVKKVLEATKDTLKTLPLDRDGLTSLKGKVLV